MSLRKPALKSLIDVFDTKAALSDDEVLDALRAELAFDRAEVARQMWAIIRDARRRGDIHSGIFGPISGIAQRVADYQRAVERYASDKDSVQYRVAQGLVASNQLVLETAKQLHTARLPVSHADPADYWERAADAWGRGQEPSL